MEKVYTLLWILFGLGVYVFRLVKKAQETSARENQERPARPGPAVPGLPTATFQELLKQMQARNVAGPDTTPAPAPVPAPSVPALRTLGGRLMPREVARPVRSQERAVARALSLEARAAARPRNAPGPLARRSSALPRASVVAPVQDYWQEPAAPAAPLSATVRQWLSQPESVRAGLVLSEILKRKYD
ncbi:hypothetical protein [Hymenobacter sp.]|uniref:hypothetical protein n=1 Tax=Hymenobacter sp. TaxID=1898978 RepID=UPI00286D2E05|nr:hypothetical protein [Hymenobacter sp.]